MVVPRDVVSEKFSVPNIVKSYSRIPDVITAALPHPDPARLLRDLQARRPPGALRRDLPHPGLHRQPPGDALHRLQLRRTEVRPGRVPRARRDLRRAARVNVELLVKETGEIKEQEIFMGDFPLMTEKGTFIINGAERVVVSQLVRSPGVYLTLERDATSGRDLCYAKLIPNRGAWLEFETSNKDVISVKVDRKRKIPITTLLRAIDEPDLLPEAPQHDGASRRSRSRSTPPRPSARPTSCARRCSQLLGTNERILAIFEDVDTGDDHQLHPVHAGPRHPRREQGRGAARVLPPPPPRRPAHDRERQAAHQLAVLQPAPLRPRQGRPLQGEQAPRPHERHHASACSCPDDLVAIVREIVHLNNGHGKSDDIDHLGNRRVRTVGELIQNQFRIGLLRMERVDPRAHDDHRPRRRPRRAR